MVYFHHEVKPMNLLKESEFNSRFESELRKLLDRVPFLKVQSIKSDVKISSRQLYQPDIVARIKTGTQSWTLIGETKRLGQPREIRAAALQIEKYLSQLKDKGRYGVILAPFISDESAAICEKFGVGYVDLSGNARLSFGQVYIETRAAENAFKRKKEARSLFTPRAQRVLRILLQGPIHPWKGTALARDAQVSLGWVSAVRQQLLAHEWAREEGGGLLITKPDKILDEWIRSDHWKDRTEIRQYSLIHTEPREIATRLQTSLQQSRYAFTQWFAGWLRHPYTVPPIVTAFVEEWPDERILERNLQARRVSQGGRLWLAKPRDVGVFNPNQKVDGFTLVSDVQIYLDLAKAAQRGEEQAAELRKLPDFSGGWK
jgi:hypothetical protein